MKYVKAYQRGLITGQERHRNVRDVWNHTTETVGKALMAKLKTDTREGSSYINTVRHGQLEGSWFRSAGSSASGMRGRWQAKR